jgi:hypothetical protein
LSVAGNIGLERVTYESFGYKYMMASCRSISKSTVNTKKRHGMKRVAVECTRHEESHYETFSY